MIYTIIDIQSKQTSTGKNKHDVVLKDEQGVTVDKITIWDSFPDFANLKIGATINADVVIKQNGQYTNKTAYPTKIYSQWKPNSSPRAPGGQMGAVMKQKEASIEKAQDNKAYGIMVASTASMATEILTSIMKIEGEVTPQKMQEGMNPNWREEWLKIRYWLVKNWENVEQKKVAGTDIDYPQNDDPIPF